jgi:hypothetical protein
MNAVAQFPELALGAPEATQTENRGLGPFRIRGFQRSLIDEVLGGSGDRRLPSRQRVGGGWHLGLLAEHEHEVASPVIVPMILPPI